MKRAFKLKQKAFFIIFKELSNQAWECTFKTDLFLNVSKEFSLGIYLVNSIYFENVSE